MFSTSYDFQKRFLAEQEREVARRQKIEARIQEQIANPTIPRCDNPGCRAERPADATICPECHYPY